MVAVNNVSTKLTNWSENVLCDYSIYDGTDATTDATFFVEKDGIRIYNSEQSEIATQTKFTFSIPLEIETLDDTEFIISAFIQSNNVDLITPLDFDVDNTFVFPAVLGSVFYLTPILRNNSQSPF